MIKKTGIGLKPEMQREKNPNRVLELLEKRADRILERNAPKEVEKPVRLFWMLARWGNGDGSIVHAARAELADRSPLFFSDALCGCTPSNGWAVSLVERETCHACASLLRGRPVATPELPNDKRDARRARRQRSAV